MRLNLLIATLFASVVLVACGDGDSPKKPTKSTNGADDANTAVLITEVPSDIDIPASCAEYFATVERFIAQYPELNESYKEGMLTTKQQLDEAADDAKAAFDETCQSALDDFKHSISNLPN